jgi:AbrB family looped-hinge helix DNA binding protein
MTKIATYKVEDIFQDIPGDEENILMTIPPEVAEKMGWKPGDRLSVKVREDQSISIMRIENDKK